MVVQTECIQRYEPSLSRSYIPVKTLTSSLRLDIRNSTEKKGPRLSCQVAHMIILAVEYLSFEQPFLLLLVVFRFLALSARISTSHAL